MVRYTKVFLVFCVAFWGLIGTVGNLSDIQSVYDAVRDVTSMEGIPEGFGPPWRTTNPIVVWIGVLFIVLGKLTALIGAGYGAVRMFKCANGTAQDFAAAKQWAIAGCAATFGLLILSFTIIAEGAFFMFVSPSHSEAAAIAFRFAGSFALITIFVAMPDAD